MKCTNCGNEVNPEFSFCTKCGTKIVRPSAPESDNSESSVQPNSNPAQTTPQPQKPASHPEPAAERQQKPNTVGLDAKPVNISNAQVQNPVEKDETKPKKTNKGFIVVIVIAAIAIICAVAALVVSLGASSSGNGSDQKASEESSSESNNAEDSEEDVREKYDFNWGYIELNKQLRDDAKLEESDLHLFIYSKDTGATIASIGPETSQSAPDLKMESYTIGNVKVGQAKADIFLNLFYIDSDGKNVGPDSDSNELAIAKYCKLTPDQLCDRIYITSGNGSEYTKAVLGAPSVNAPSDSAPSGTAEGSNSNADSNAAAGSSPNSNQPQHKFIPKPFWGVWVGAFKDPSNAFNYVSSLKSRGYSEAEEYISNEWTNLNQDRFYVVTVGTYPTQEAANAALPRIQAEIESTAYVKYTGDFRGFQ